MTKTDVAIPDHSHEVGQPGGLLSSVIDSPKVRLVYTAGEGMSYEPTDDYASQGEWLDALMSALGVRSCAMVDALMEQLLNFTGATNVSSQEEATKLERTVENALAFIQEAAPSNAVEAVLAFQMWASHLATMKASRGVHRATDHEALTAYGRLMNKSMRTTTAQIEALQKLRTGGKQQVEVRYVYVDARTQTLINEPAGGGGLREIKGQPHAAGADGFGEGAAVWSENPIRRGLPIPGGEGPPPLPDARRDKPRRAPRRTQRALSPRPLHQGDDGAEG